MGRAPRTREIDVLVVSNGTTGLTMALALSSYGLRVHVVSRTRWLDPAVDSQLLDRQSMAVFRELGVADDLAKAATQWPTIGGAVFAEALGRDEIGRVEQAVDGSDGAPIDIAQSALANVLLYHATARGATIAFNGDYLGQQQDEDGVTVTLHDSVLDRIHTLRAGYLFGADGYTGRGVDDTCTLHAGNAATMATVEARFSADLSARLGDRPTVFNWVAAPDPTSGRNGAGLLRAISPWHEWTARWDVALARGRAQPDPGQIHRCVQAMIGDDHVPITLGEISLRPISHDIVQARGKRRVYCGGDVIRYQTQPGGPGTNQGIQDAYNLAWKLAMVALGEAGAGLLDSYSVERAPIESPRLTVIAGGKGTSRAPDELPLSNFVTGPFGSREIARALQARACDVPALDRRRSSSVVGPRAGREPANAFARPPVARPRGPASGPHVREHAGH